MVVRKVVQVSLSRYRVRVTIYQESIMWTYMYDFFSLSSRIHDIKISLLCRHYTPYGFACRKLNYGPFHNKVDMVLKHFMWYCAHVNVNQDVELLENLLKNTTEHSR